MFNNAIRSFIVSTSFVVVAAASSLGLVACGAADEDEGDRALEAAPSEAALLEGVRADAGCDAIYEWVTRNADRLPTRYADVTRYPMTYRKAIVSTFDPEAKSSFWKEHFRHYMAAHPELTAEQAAFIQKLGASASADFFSRSPGDAAAEAIIDNLSREGLMLFDKDSLGQIIAQLGPDTEEKGSVGGATTYLMGAPNCVCSTKDDWCGSSNHCQSGSCRWLPNSCGTFGWRACDGLCYPNQ
ncbi:bacteriocin fulvocin C-related protein [Sorangium sp. So ce394]|uniref:bacteriocin fulvocin C-related protein n=1 Tax=Sorangium sp. So ce394 TaxID=3133310 RepID=UPI003F5BED41